MTERREHFALDWIKRELDETLKTARLALEAYAETKGDETRMRACLTHLHQVHGTLLMLELTGVSTLSDEMEQLAQALLNGSVRDPAPAQQSLMQAILQLPAYLEEIQKGLPDSRRAVLPLANELRVARGERPFPDTSATSRHTQGVSPENLERFDRIDGTEKARKIRAAYQQVLLAILRGQDKRTALATLEKVAIGLERIAEGTPLEPLWRAFGLFVKSLVAAQVDLSADIVKLLRRVDAEMKTLAQDGRAALERPVDVELVRQLVAESRSRGHTHPDLDRFVAGLEPGDEEERLGISRREATQTAAAALREEIAAVKDKLDLFVRGEGRDVEALKALTAPLKQIASTLSILGFESSRAIVGDQLEALQAATQSGRVADGQLLVAASALLQVDENLAAIASDRTRRLGAQGEASAVIDAAQHAVLKEARNGLEQVKQAVVDYVSAQWDVRHLQGVPDLLAAVGGALAMVPLAQAAEQLQRCARYVRERLVPGPAPDWTALDNFADAISGVDYFLERLADDAGMPTQDVLGGVERSLTALGYGAGMSPQALPHRAPAVAADIERDGAEVVLRESEQSVEREVEQSVEREVEQSVETHPAPAEQIVLEPLATPTSDEAETPPRAIAVALDEDDDVVPEPVSVEEVDDAGFDLGSDLFESVEGADGGARVQPSTIAAAHESVRAEAHAEAADEAVVAPAPRPAAPTPAARVARPAVAVDDDIVEIFVEEVGEVLDTIGEWLPRWIGDYTDETALTEVRRSFHTLKGSGRIVGASLLGELAWSIENMLNRVIDGTIAGNEQLGRVTREAAALIPVLRDDFEARRPSDEAAAAVVMERADVLASGGSLEEVASAAPMTSGAAAAPPRVAVPDVQTSVDANVDTFDLFAEEARRHLDVLEAHLGGDNATSVLDEDVMRALHTLRGSAAMAGVDAVCAIADPIYRVASAARDAGVEPSGDMVDLLQQGVFALRRTVTALEDGREPDEETELFAREADRLISGLEAKSSRASSLLDLEGTATLIDARTFLESWRDGTMDLGILSDTIAALHELRNEAESQSLDSLTELCDALLATYERFEDHPLDAVAYAAFDAAHEHLLTLFDAIAAEQRLPDVSACVDALHALTTQEAPAGMPERQVAIPEPADDLIEVPELTVEPAQEVEEIPLLDVETDAELAAPEPIETSPPAIATVSVPAPAPVPSPAVAPPPRAVPPAHVARLTLPEDADPDILGIFFEEADELLEGMDHCIQDWLDDRGNRVHVEKLLRALHTLKGGARLAGLLDLGEETHAFESFVVSAQQGPFDDAFFSSLHDRHDRITAHVIALERVARGEEPEDVAPSASAAGAAPSSPADSASQVVTPAAQGSTSPDSGTRAPSATVDEVAAVEPAREAVAHAPSPAAVEREPEPAPEDESAEVVAFPRRGEPAAARTPQDSEMVRVSAHLLEQLVDLAGESSIVRSRVEQGINDFATALDEMETTIERVREQLRRLEIETETQVLYRRETAAGPDYEEFDPLEMDRYSQLQQLSRSLSESASDMLDLKETLANKSREAETLLLQQARLNTEIQEGLMRTRMVPFSRLLPRLRRIVRQVAKDVGKDVELHAYNAEGELDRNVLDRMVAPLEHMLRNAIDHGIERPELRRTYGKPPTGRIDLRLSREGADVVIEVADDGGGIDVESVRAKAVERGLMDPDAELKDDEILQFVLAPGFSTAQLVTQISGRGVGMDVVHSAVKQLGGTIAITSIPGRGTRFTIRLPIEGPAEARRPLG